MIYPLVLELADDGVPVAVACRGLGASKQAFYRWRADPVTERDWADLHLTNAAIDAHRDGRRSSSARWVMPAWSDRWAESVRARTTLQWNRSSRSCRRTS